MWRTRAVRHLLISEVGGIRVVEREQEAVADEEAEDRSHISLPVLGEAEEALGQARRRAAIVVVLDVVAILALLLLGGGDGPLSQLTLGRSEQTVFTIAILLLAAHAGFRLGQLEKYNAVARANEELTERDPHG